MQKLIQQLDEMPLIAILRGISPTDIEVVAEVLYSAGLRIIEVPLNSPDPYQSIERLTTGYGDRCLCGAGTVLNVAQVEQVYKAGGKLVVSPNTDSAVIQRTIELGMISIPGFHSATEAFTAIDAGAHALKLFPAQAIGTEYLQSLKAVLPPIPIIATGGIGNHNLNDWRSAGAQGFGIGSDLYQPDISADTLKQRAATMVAACKTLPI
jgi:2-dehydro-3-deoxyphosphogalactonate aldolase